MTLRCMQAYTRHTAENSIQLELCVMQHLALYASLSVCKSVVNRMRV